MKTTIAIEKEKILSEIDKLYFPDGYEPGSDDAALSRFISNALDHIASVARQEGREEAVKEVSQIKIAPHLPEGMKPNLDEEIWNNAIDKVLAKLTGNEEHENS